MVAVQQEKEERKKNKQVSVVCTDPCWTEWRITHRNKVSVEKMCNKNLKMLHFTVLGSSQAEKKEGLSITAVNPLIIVKGWSEQRKFHLQQNCAAKHL